MEIIFYHQLTNQRTISANMAKARRRWIKHFSWFPVKQNELYSEMDRVYKETRSKNGEDFFKSYALERRLNNRIYNQDINEKIPYANYNKFPTLKKHMDETDTLPLFYYYENCGKPKACTSN